jgi:protease I
MLLEGRQALIFAGDLYEDLELWYPKLRLEEAGATVTLAGIEAGREYQSKHGYPCTTDAAVSNVDPGAYDALLIPGGWMPDQLRRDGHVLRVTRAFAESRKVIACICHGGWILASAGVCRGVRLTSTSAIKDDLINAGAEWEDAPVVVHQNFITSRRPPDLPAFGAAIVNALRSEGKRG